jgi:hypothetical protein
MAGEKEEVCMGIHSVTYASVGEIARRTGYPLHRVEYVIRSRRIEPTGRAGNVRVFTDAEVDRIASELRRIDAEKGDGL